MAFSFSIIPGKFVRTLMRHRGSGGSALPGLIAEKIDPSFMARTLKSLPRGVVVISGTNGKTTTTKIVVKLLESQGLKVFTNKSGSNFTRGIVSELLGSVSLMGKLSADIAVLELDEAHAIHFIHKIKPDYSLFLNVLRDQLDRFGEIDYTAKLLAQVATATTKNIIVNREDPLLLHLAQKLDPEKVVYYGLQKNLLTLFPDDAQLHSSHTKIAKKPPAHILLETVHQNKIKLYEDGKSSEVTLKLNGVHNAFNSVAALTLVETILGSKLKKQKLFKALQNVEPAFGRGETIDVNGFPTEIVLIKNPSGFQLSLLEQTADDAAMMIAINDNYADGRDVSWLYDVDFSHLGEHGVSVVSGTRAYDMLLRLHYDEIAVASTDSDLSSGLQKLLAIKSPRRIFCTYTAMLKIREELATITTVERAL